MHRVIAIVMMVSFTMPISASAVHAQAVPSELPTEMLGFLTPGAHIGVYQSETRDGNSEPFFSLTLYEDDGYELAVDARKLSLDELCEKYPAVAKRAEKTLADYEKVLIEKANELDAGKRYAEPTLSMQVSRRTLFCTVIYVGDDYALLSYDKSKRKWVLPKHMINRILWTKGLPHLYARARVVEIEADETEPSDAR